MKRYHPYTIAQLAISSETGVRGRQGLHMENHSDHRAAGHLHETVRSDVGKGASRGK